MTSHHLDWLARKAKDILPPPLLFVSELCDGNSGCYYSPFAAEIQLGDAFISLDKGLILISESQLKIGGDLENTLAHEWRHHWQWFNFPGEYHSTKFSNDDIDYKSAIIEFFKEPREFDALIFSHHEAPCEATHIWLSWIKEHYLLRRQIAV